MPGLDASLALFEEGLNRYLRLDPEAPRLLEPLSGRVIGVEILGLDLRLYFVPGPSSIQVLGRFEGEPDCLLRGTPLALARVGFANQREDQLFSGQVEVIGDTETAQRFGALWAGLDVDWEEQLSRLTGDLIAHEAGNLVRGLDRWARHAAHSLTADLQEYLQEEIRVLPTAYEAQGFADEVDRLRDDVERLEARLQRAERRLAEPPHEPQ